MKYFIFLLLLLNLFACSKKERSKTESHSEVSFLKNKSFFENSNKAFAYISDSQYADDLEFCVDAISEKDACTPKRLPLIGQKVSQITPRDILTRTVVSHEFLGDAFKDVLEKLPSEILQMFGAVNGVVISDLINPSFYRNETGVIYLSGRYFWRNQKEKRIVSIAQDDREGNSSALPFEIMSTYIRNRHTLNYSENPQIQTTEEMTFRLARLFIHELTHANDFFPKSFYTSQEFDINSTYFKISNERYDGYKLISDQMPSYPRSSALQNLAKFYNNRKYEQSSLEQLTADIVAEEFSKDVVNDDYNYLNSLEDAAMLMEELLMSHLFNLERLWTITKLPHAHYEWKEKEELPIFWGKKNIIQFPSVKKRALYVVESVFDKKFKQEIEVKSESIKPVTYKEGTTWEELIRGH